MTPYEYLMIRNSPEQDTSPALFFYYQQRGGHLNKNEFDVYLIEFLIYVGNSTNKVVIARLLGLVISFVFRELDKQFKDYL